MVLPINHSSFIRLGHIQEHQIALLLKNPKIDNKLSAFLG